MTQPLAWRAGFAGRRPARQLRGWLTEPGSLTTRCQRFCREFRVRVLQQSLGQALADEQVRRGRVRIREVLLECDGVPVIFAHTTLSATANGRLARWLAGLGNRSLGSLLFVFPGFRRGPLEFCRLDARHPLWRRVRDCCGDVENLWARRSSHWLGGQQVLVTEVFLPAIENLA